MDLSLLPSAAVYLNELVADTSGAPLAFQVYYWGAQTEHYDNPVHRHSYWEICYVVDGQGEYTDGQDEYKLQAGTLFCSRPGVWHQIRSASGLAMIFVAFQPDVDRCSEQALQMYAEAMKAPHMQIVIQQADGHPAVMLWLALVQWAIVQPYEGKERLQEMAHTLLAGFPQTFARSGKVSPGGDSETEAAQTSQTQSKLVHLAKHFIRDNVARPLTMKDVASYLHVSERHLSRMFGLHSDQTFSAYLRKERMRQAVSLLQTTNHTLKEIAELTGFESIHYFTRVFTSQYGLPPGKFREEQFRKGADPL